MKLTKTEDGFKDFNCPHCGQAIENEACCDDRYEWGGIEENCPSCGKKIVINMSIEYDVEKL